MHVLAKWKSMLPTADSKAENDGNEKEEISKEQLASAKMDVDMLESNIMLVPEIVLENEPSKEDANIMKIEHFTTELHEDISVEPIAEVKKDLMEIDKKTEISIEFKVEITISNESDKIVSTETNTVIPIGSAL